VQSPRRGSQYSGESQESGSSRRPEAESLGKIVRTTFAEDHLENWSDQLQLGEGFRSLRNVRLCIKRPDAECSAMGNISPVHIPADTPLHAHKRD
jgi:hypothetical protein